MASGRCPTQRSDAIHFLVNLMFLNACISLKTSLINTKLGDFVKLGLHFMIM